MWRKINDMHSRLGLPLRCVLAVGIFIIALMLRLWMFPVEAGFANVTFYPMMVVAFYLCGFGPGFLAAILSAITAYYIFIPPYWVWQPTRDGNIAIGAFLISAIFIGYVIAQMQSFGEKITSLLNSSKKKIAELNESQSIANLGSYVLNIESGIWESSMVLDQIFGIDKAFAHSLSGWESLVHVDDRELMRNYLLVDVVENQNEFNREYRIVRNDDQVIRWVHGMGRLELGNDGQPILLHGTIQDITEKKSIENFLRVSEEQFRLAFNNANAGMCFVNASDGNLLKVNERMCEIFGREKDELEGKSLNNMTLPEDSYLVPEQVAKKLSENNNRISFEKRYRHKDGHILFCNISTSLMFDAQGRPDYFISHIEDITGRKKTEEELLQSEKRHNALTQNTQDVIWTMNLDGTFSYFSPSLEVALGYTVDEALKMKLEQFLPVDSILNVKQILEKARNEIQRGLIPQKFVSELQQRRKDGSLIWTEVMAYPFSDAQGNIIEILGVTRNIEERKQFALALQQAHEEAIAAKQALEHANQELKLQAATDPLTGVFNRRHFELLVSSRISLALRHDKPICLVMLDIDHFKAINDSLGHHVGDLVLVELVQLIESQLRAGDDLARWGGEEFMILLPYCSEENGKSIAEKLRKLIEGHAFSGSVGTVTASFGVAQWRKGENLDHWSNRVDMAMYKAKEAGRNQVRVDPAGI